MFQVFGEEPDFAEELLSGVGGIGGFANPGITKKLKSTGDSSSTSPERRKDDALADVESVTTAASFTTSRRVGRRRRPDTEVAKPP